MSRREARPTVIAAARMSALSSAIASPKVWPLEIPSCTITPTPTIMAAIASKVETGGRSFRNTHERSAPNIGLKATMKTTLAVAVLKTESRKVSVDRP